jgi:hypothetical protein
MTKTCAQIDKKQTQRCLLGVRQQGQHKMTNYVDQATEWDIIQSRMGNAPAPAKKDPGSFCRICLRN